MNRRQFIKSALVSTVAADCLVPTTIALAQPASGTANPLPRWRGFNLTDFNSPNPGPARGGTTEDDLKWMVDWGFNFIRLPMAYPRYVEFDRSQHITPAEVYKLNNAELDRIDSFVRNAHKHGLHVSLNLHRAPGYCINAGFYEPYDLWKSKDAQQAFAFHWGMWAKRFKDVPASKLSFDLLNEPCVRSDMNDQHSKGSPIPGELYRAVAAQAVEAIRAASPDRLIIADGNNVGNTVTPELKDLHVAQSCRGYFPGLISHYRAPWANKDPEKCPTPVWPGTMNGEQFGRARLESYYKPWIELAKSGIGVHCGECGCWNKTPHSVFLAWFGDVLDVLTSNAIGYALWNFRGDFGILDSRREDVAYQDWYGHKLDAKLLELLKAH
jgi:endoglucanase